MTKTRPLILVVNDDGYEARGLEAMIEIAKPLGEVAVVVPDRTRSGMGHAITMGEPLRLTNYKNEDGISYYKTNGTPVDCVKLGEKVVLRNRKVDLLLSGINHGSNSSVSLIYSGTMAAAIEAAFVKDVVGYVDAHYRTLADKRHRAIAGLSMGGFHSLYISLNNPDTFDYVGLFSAAINRGNPQG